MARERVRWSETRRGAFLTKGVSVLANHRKNVDVVIASNRLPVRVSVAEGKVSTEPTVGGLAAALGGLTGSHRWVGWPGAVVPPEYEIRVRKRLATDGLRPVFLSAEDEDGF